VKEALAAIEKGGYAEAVARIGALVGRFAGAIPLYRLEMAEGLVKTDKVLSKLSEGQMRRLRSEAGVMVLLEPERTLRALPMLLSKKEDRERVLSILEMGRSLDGVTNEQLDMVDRIVDVIKEAAPKGKSVRAGRKKSSVK
jgi:hypothetical protein